MRVSLFFTFWGTSVLRKPHRTVGKDLFGRLFGWMLPRGSRQLPLSRLNFGGGGALMIRYLMKKKGVASLEELITLSAELGVQFNVCTMSMDLLGLQRDELIDYPDLNYCGVATFVESAAASKTSLFL
jgi:peroxiredoxin family protein